MARGKSGTVQPAGNAASSRDGDYFDQWVTLYTDYYPAGSRLDLEYRISRMMVLAAKAWVHRIDNILRVETGQTRARWQALFALAFSESPVTMSELCRRVHVKWPTMVRVVEAMLEDGLIEREDNPADGRSRLVGITAEGRQVMARIQPILDRERSAMLARLTTDELKIGADLLERIFADAMGGDEPD